MPMFTQVTIYLPWRSLRRLVATAGDGTKLSETKIAYMGRFLIRYHHLLRVSHACFGWPRQGLGYSRLSTVDSFICSTQKGLSDLLDLQMCIICLNLILSWLDYLLSTWMSFWYHMTSNVPRLDNAASPSGGTSSNGPPWLIHYHGG